MTFDWQSVVTISAIIAAIIAIVGHFAKGVRWFDNQSKQGGKIETLQKKHDEGIERSKEKRFGDRFVVINLDTGEVYQTQKDASRATGIHNDSISRVCKGKSKTAGGYRWRYLNE